jgi:ubiquinone/menaquinone biosynthesis C-methylase UbiE
MSLMPDLRGDPDERFDPEVERLHRESQRRSREIPSDYYSLSQPGMLYVYQQMARDFVRTLAREGQFPLGTRRVLDVGCGYGSWLLELDIWGAEQGRLAGIDLDPTRAARAAARLPAADIRTGDATSLPWASASFDTVIQSTAFTSILEQSMRTAVAGEIARVLAPDGMVLWYDFFRQNPRNPNVRAMRLHELRELFPGFDIAHRRVTLAGPIARRLAPWSWTGCLVLESLKLLNTHYLAVLRRS